MTALIIATVFAATAVAALVVINDLTRRLERLTTALQGVLYGTYPDGTPRPRCPECLNHADDQDGQKHVPGCWAHVPGDPSSLTEQ